MLEKRVFHYRDFAGWRASVLGLIDDALLTGPVVEHLRAAPPEYISSDNLSWLESAVIDVHGRHVDAVGHLQNRFASAYTHLRAFHGCCPVDLGSYRAHGILPLNTHAAKQELRRVFSVTRFPEVTDDVLQKAIKDVSTNLREGRVYLTLDDDSLIEFAGHYLLYGSEYLTGIAASLTGMLSEHGKDYRQVLRNRGRPTLIECDIPLSMVGDEVLSELAGTVLEYLGNHLLGRDVLYACEFGFEVYEPVPPDAIVAFRHPVRINDPLTKRIESGRGK